MTAKKKLTPKERAALREHLQDLAKIIEQSELVMVELCQLTLQEGDAEAGVGLVILEVQGGRVGAKPRVLLASTCTMGMRYYLRAMHGIAKRLRPRLLKGERLRVRAYALPLSLLAPFAITPPRTSRLKSREKTA